MTIPTWPGTVPYVPRLDDFDVGQLYTPPAVNQPEDGPPIMRRWASTNITKLSYALVLTKAQKDAFVVFVRDTLNHGTSRFTMRVGQRGDSSSSSWPFKTCWIAGQVQGPKPYGDTRYIVKFELNVLDW
jgi:hypothetical protein